MLYKTAVKWNKIHSKSFTLDLLPMAEFGSQTLGSGPSLQRISQLLPQSLPLPTLVCLLIGEHSLGPHSFSSQNVPLPHFFQSQLKFHQTKERYILGDREAGFKEDTHIPTGSLEALLHWTPASTGRSSRSNHIWVSCSVSSLCYAPPGQEMYWTSVQYSFPISFSNTHTPSHWESLLQTCSFPVSTLRCWCGTSTGQDPSVHG